MYALVRVLGLGGLGDLEQGEGRDGWMAGPRIEGGVCRVLVRLAVVVATAGSASLEFVASSPAGDERPESSHIPVYGL